MTTPRAESAALRMTKVVLLGGGYTSFGAWRVLRGALRKDLSRRRVRVTVVSTRNYHYFHGFVGEMIGGVLGVADVMSPARSIFAGAEFITGTVTRVDAGTRHVHVRTPGNAADLLLEYDHLVVGLGARYRRGTVEGLDTFGWALRDVGVVQGFRNHVIDCFERAETLHGADDRRRALTFVVAGGGLAGVEITAALCELSSAMRKHYPVLERVRPHMVLVHSGQRILPELAADSRVVTYARTQLARYGVELLVRTRVARLERGMVTLSTGAVIETDTVLCTVGNEVAPMPGLERFPSDHQGRIRTNACLRLDDAPEIWAGGDCARVRRPGRDEPCPTNALWATRHGEHIGYNLARVIGGKPPKPFQHRGLGIAASMGLGKGMGELFGVPVTGWVAWLLRLLVFLWFMPSGHQALGALLELGKLPFRGRCLVPVDLSMPPGLLAQSAVPARDLGTHVPDVPPRWPHRMLPA